uniref:uncharacterized protein C9orf40 homolog isoform X1 n=1 Tax=Callithrix jacchus TaxID=9483 RepID=UPI0023DCFDEE|nr:uncharacterized protein C9orf40 homolog isoform X1 [Callithrix jacchus]
MAKRRAAEPLTFHVPWKRLLLCDFPEQPPPPPPLWIRQPGAAHPGQPFGVPEQHRKRKIDAGTMAEPSASPSKRRDSGDNSAPGGQEQEDRGLETGEPPLLLPPPPPPLPVGRGPGEELQGDRPLRGGGDDGAGRAGPQRGDWGVAPRQRRKEKVTAPREDADPQETRPGIPKGRKHWAALEGNGLWSGAVEVALRRQRRALTMKNFGSIIPSSTGGILCHLLIWQTLKI